MATPDTGSSPPRPHRIGGGRAFEQDSLVDGLTPTTADTLHGESHGYSEVDGCLAAPGDTCDVPAWEQAPAEAGTAAGSGKPTDSVTVRGAPREPGRVYLMAPARWKSGDSSARRRPVAPAVLMPAPAQWIRSRVVRSRLPPSAPHPAAERWLLPPAWPLDGWHVTAVAGLRRLVDARIVPWARARMPSWLGWARAHWRRLAAGVAMGAIAGAALVLLRSGMLHPGAGSTPVRAVVAASAGPASVMRAPSLPARPAPMSAPASAPTVASAVRSGPAETGRKLLSDVSTMDLMMPIAEPDLDIRSQHSLWSQVGKASGVDPLLLYSIALVESKALYPDGKVAPTPWLFRVDDHLVRGDRHDVQLAMAAASQFGGAAVQDVGIMQVYYPMHRDAVRDPLTLLNPHTNISVAAKILRDGMRQTPDRVLGVGYYHSHTPALARNYGTAVLTVYQRLKAIHRPAHRGQAVAR
ncbi:hypothetical protein [Rhodanobacter soli]|uniref:hypothetical protein n=1 Tax=Rhodanobacter soli TaxID=590609 RepID=UPI0031D27A0F